MRFSWGSFLSSAEMTVFCGGKKIALVHTTHPPRPNMWGVSPRGRDARASHLTPVGDLCRPIACSDKKSKGIRYPQRSEVGDTPTCAGYQIGIADGCSICHYGREDGKIATLVNGYSWCKGATLWCCHGGIEGAPTYLRQGTIGIEDASLWRRQRGKVEDSTHLQVGTIGIEDAIFQ